MAAMTTMANYIVESDRGGQWVREGTTRDPDEWHRLMGSAFDPGGTEFRVRLGDRVVLTMALRDRDIKINQNA